MAVAGPMFAADAKETAATTQMRVRMIRLLPGDDLLRGIAAYLEKQKIRAGVVPTTVSDGNAAVVFESSRVDAKGGHYPELRIVGK